MAQKIIVSGNGPHELVLLNKGKIMIKSPCFVGKNGITSNKREGDGATPAGKFEITAAFGFSSDPGFSLPYIKINDHTYLVDDPRSKFYNRIVDTEKIDPDFRSAEKMSEFPEYKYGAVIGYNKKNIPGAGSGIFLHCARKPQTHGCVSVPEEVMVRILNLLTPGAKIEIRNIQ